MVPSSLPSIVRLTFPAALASDDLGAVAAAQDGVLRQYDACAPALRRYVRSFGLPAESVEDVLQEVFLALFRHLQRGRPCAHLRGWLFQVGHHLALKQRARLALQRQRERTIDPTLADALADPAADAEQRLLSGARAGRVRAVIRALPERDRRCVYMRAEGLRYRDIARALQVSLGTVAKSIARAAVRLRNADAGDDHAR